MTTLSAQSQLGFTSSKLMRKVICSLIALVAQSLVNPAIQGALATLSTHAILNYASPIIQPTVKWSVVLVTSTLLLLQLKILPMEKNFSLITTNSLPRLVLPKVADVMNVRRLRSLRIGRQCHIQVLHSIIYPVLVLVSALVFSYLCLCVCVCVMSVLLCAVWFGVAARVLILCCVCVLVCECCVCVTYVSVYAVCLVVRQPQLADTNHKHLRRTCAACVYCVCVLCVCIVCVCVLCVCFMFVLCVCVCCLCVCLSWRGTTPIGSNHKRLYRTFAVCVCAAVCVFSVCVYAVCLGVG
jgi:hypothetical protein